MIMINNVYFKIQAFDSTDVFNVSKLFYILHKAFLHSVSPLRSDPPVSNELTNPATPVAVFIQDRNHQTKALQSTGRNVQWTLARLPRQKE